MQAGEMNDPRSEVPGPSTRVLPRDRLVLVWGGEAFQFTRMAAEGVPTWAVTRRGEFVGTLECPGGVADEELLRLAETWLNGLLGQPPAGPQPTPAHGRRASDRSD
jgi:hypothetical protein